MTIMTPDQNGHHLADNIFKCIFLTETICICIQISLQISLQFVSEVPTGNNSVLVQVMACGPFY